MEKKKGISVEALYELCKAANQEKAEIMIIVRQNNGLYYDMPSDFSVDLKENLVFFECEF